MNCEQGRGLGCAFWGLAPFLKGLKTSADSSAPLFSASGLSVPAAFSR